MCVVIGGTDGQSKTSGGVEVEVACWVAAVVEVEVEVVGIAVVVTVVANR